MKLEDKASLQTANRWINQLKQHTQKYIDSWHFHIKHYLRDIYIY